MLTRRKNVSSIDGFLKYFRYALRTASFSSGILVFVTFHAPIFGKITTPVSGTGNSPDKSSSRQIHSLTTSPGRKYTAPAESCRTCCVRPADVTLSSKPHNKCKQRVFFIALAENP